MKVNKKAGGLMLPGGLALATLGMALVTTGVAWAPLFFPGIYLLTGGLLVSAAGTALRLAHS